MTEPKDLILDEVVEVEGRSYFINLINADFNLILKAIRNANAFWHCLCVLTEVPLNSVKNNELTSIKIEEICQKIKVIIIGAYDGEGYLFWEKH